MNGKGVDATARHRRRRGGGHRPRGAGRIVAFLFDLDGVLTQTAKVHAAAWKEMFDAFLRKRAETSGESFVPFEIAADYGPYVDGKLREDGVRGFLTSRGIEMPEGDADDPPDADTIHGLATRKNAKVLGLIEEQGSMSTRVRSDSWKWCEMLGIRRAVVSASKNCEAVLEAAGIEALFEVRVDGVVAARESLQGKPKPDTFLAAARRFGLEPAACAVVEDALAGVEAGRAGNFGWVVGVDRVGDGHADALRDHGADIVVGDLSELLEDS